MTRKSGLPAAKWQIGRTTAAAKFRSKLNTVMKLSIVRRLEVMDRVKQFVLDHPFTPVMPRAAVLITNINAAADALRDRGSSQVSGTSNPSRIATQ